MCNEKRPNAGHTLPFSCRCKRSNDEAHALMVDPHLCRVILYCSLTMAVTYFVREQSERDYTPRGFALVTCDITETHRNGPCLCASITRGITLVRVQHYEGNYAFALSINNSLQEVDSWVFNRIVDLSNKVKHPHSPVPLCGILRSQGC